MRGEQRHGRQAVSEIVAFVPEGHNPVILCYCFPQLCTGPDIEDGSVCVLTGKTNQ